jgi:hypothetical protein
MRPKANRLAEQWHVAQQGSRRAEEAFGELPAARTGQRARPALPSFFSAPGRLVLLLSTKYYCLVVSSNSRRE